MRADPCDKAAALGARIDGDVLADDGMRSDLEAALLAMIFHVLGNVADRGEGEDLARLADRGAAHDRNMGLEHDAVAEPHLGPYDAERPDLDSGAKFSTWIDHGGRMNVRHARNFELSV